MHPDRAGRALGVDGHQPDPGEAVEHTADCGLVGRRAGGAGAADVVARSAAGQHRLRDTRRIEQRRHRQRVSRRFRRGDGVGPVQRQRPGGRQGPGAFVGPGTGHQPGSLRQLLAVAAAAAMAVSDHGRRHGQAQWQAAEVGGEVKRPGPHARFAEPSGQVAQRLARAERADFDDPPVASADHGGGQPGGDEDKAGRSRRPEPVQVAGIGDVVEHHQPRSAGLGQPGQEAGRGDAGISAGAGDFGCRQRLRVTAQNRVSAGSLNPCEQVYIAGSPRRQCDRGGELGLAGAAQGVHRVASLRLGRSRLGEHRCPAGARGAGPRLRARVEARGQRRHRSRPDRPGCVPGRHARVGLAGDDHDQDLP